MYTWNTFIYQHQYTYCYILFNNFYLFTIKHQIKNQTGLLYHLHLSSHSSITCKIFSTHRQNFNIPFSENLSVFYWTDFVLFDRKHFTISFITPFSVSLLWPIDIIICFPILIFRTFHLTNVLNWILVSI